MDNKITKSRLSNFLSYEWIFVLVALVVSVLVWEIIFSVSAARLSLGQSFYYYYDEQMYAGNKSELQRQLEDKKTFSYEVQEITNEVYVDGQNSVDILSLRVVANEVDCVFTNTVRFGEGEAYKSCRANTLIDSGNYLIGSIDKLYENACNYLKIYLKDGETDFTDYEKLDENKIKERFKNRASSDNRYRAGLISETDEYGRIKKLCEEVKTLQALFEYDDKLPEDAKLFYRYRRGEQGYQTTTDETSKNNFKQIYDNSNVERFAVNVEQLIVADGATDKLNSTDYFRFSDGRTTSQDAVIMFFDYIPTGLDFSTETKYDLQFEKISFINFVVKNFSSILD